MGRLALIGYWPTLPRWRLRTQNVIDPSANVIEACSDGDVWRVREILAMGEAHPNDRTPDNITVLWVSR